MSVKYTELLFKIIQLKLFVKDKEQFNKQERLVGCCCLTIYLKFIPTFSFRQEGVDSYKRVFQNLMNNIENKKL